MWRFLFTPRWLAFHLLMGLTVALTINLGLWQLDRLDERRQFNSVVSDRTGEEARPLGAVLRSAVADDDLEWTPVLVEGQWLPDDQILIINRSQGGVAGRNVVTPLVTDDGSVVAVTRGFVGLAQEPPLPSLDTVRLRGLLRPSESRGFGGVSDPATGRLAEMQRLDLERLRQQLPAPLASRLIPWSVTLEASDPPLTAPLVAVPRPTLSEGPHLSYAGQWFVFSVCALIGWLFAIRRSIASRRARTLEASRMDATASTDAAETMSTAETHPTSPA